MVAVKDGIFPEPDAVKPIVVKLFVQLYPVPDPVKLNAKTDEPLQTTRLAIESTIGVGLTVIVNVCPAFEQETLPVVIIGVTVIVAVTGEVVVLIAVKDGIFPEPDAAKPIDAVLFIQE